MLTVTYDTSCFRVGATLGYEYNICWNEFINWRSFLSRHSFHVKRKGWTESKLAERTRERERKRDGALLQKGCGVGNKLGQVIYKRQRKDNPGPYQDGNKASPKNLWKTNVFSVSYVFLPIRQTSDMRYSFVKKRFRWKKLFLTMTFPVIFVLCRKRASGDIKYDSLGEKIMLDNCLRSSTFYKKN